MHFTKYNSKLKFVKLVNSKSWIFLREDITNRKVFELVRFAYLIYIISHYPREYHKKIKNPCNSKLILENSTKLWIKYYFNLRKGY